MSKQQLERDQLARELHAAEDKLVGLERQVGLVRQKQQDEVPSYDFTHSVGRRAQMHVISESVQLGRAIKSLKKAISDKRYQLADLDRALSFGAEIEQAEASHQRAVAAAEQAQETLSNLRGSRKELSARLEQLRSQAETVLNQAIQRERSSADAYTRALKAGNTDASQVAEEMRTASIALGDARQEHAGKERVFKALEGELGAFDNQIAEAERIADEEAKAVSRAVAIKLGIAWDKQASKFVSLGSDLLEARKAAGLPVDGLRDLNIPRFSTFRAKAIGVRELEEVAPKRIA